MNISIILAGGNSRRFANSIPKQYQSLMGREIISFSVEAMKESVLTDRILIVSDRDSVNRLAETYGVLCIEGGDSRNASLRNAIDYIHDHYPECINVLINEAARPFLTAEIVDEYYGYLSVFEGVITAQYLSDSLGREGEAVTLRDEYYLIQAPEAFRFQLLYRYFSAQSPITATVQHLPKDRKVKMHFNFRNNMKITYPEDMIIAEELMKLRNINGCT